MGSYRRSFKSVVEVTNLCVAILAVVGLLVSVGFFKFRIEPTLKILKPIYSFDMSEIIEAFKTNAPGLPVPSDWLALTNQLVYLHVTNKFDLRNPSFSLPFYFAKTFSDADAEANVIRSSDPPDMFYQLGLATSPSDYIAATPNFSSKRTDEAKRLALFFPVFLDEVALAKERNLLWFGNSIEENPLLRLQTLMPHTDRPQFGDLPRVAAVAEATFVYSIISVANRSSEPIEDIRVSIANSIFSGGVTLIGWSNIPQYVEATEKNENYHITIERLDPHQSIEIVFRGHKVLHEADLGIASSWTFDKAKVGIFVFCTLLISLAFYFGDYLHVMVKTFSRRALDHLKPLRHFGK